jgi:hypothetical protein
MKWFILVLVVFAMFCVMPEPADAGQCRVLGVSRGVGILGRISHNQAARQQAAINAAIRQQIRQQQLNALLGFGGQPVFLSPPPFFQFGLSGRL